MQQTPYAKKHTKRNNNINTEAEHRSTFYIPYWNVPLLRAIVPRQRAFAADMKVIDATLDALIRRARETRQEDDLEALQARDYANVKDPSLLRFLVDMRGEDATDKQLRDDLMVRAGCLLCVWMCV